MFYNKDQAKGFVQLQAASTQCFVLTKNMTREKMTMGKGAAVKVLWHTTHPSKQIRNNYPNKDMGKRLKNAILSTKELKKYSKKIENV